MHVRNIIQEFKSDLISDKLSLFKLETGQYLVIHYGDSPRVIEFEDKKKFASYVVDYLNEFGKRYPEFHAKREEFDFLFSISKLLVSNKEE